MSGLKSKPQWNGKKARVVGEFQWHQARYPVQIITQTDDDEKTPNPEHSALLKPANLKVQSSIIHNSLICIMRKTIREPINYYNSQIPKYPAPQTSCPSEERYQPFIRGEIY